MFSLSAVSKLLWDSKFLTSDETDHDIWLGGFDFFIQYVQQRMSSSIYSQDDLENSADWLRSYYRTKLNNVRVITPCVELSDLIAVVKGEEKQRRLADILRAIVVIGWNEKALAIKTSFGLPKVITSFDLSYVFGTFSYCLEDRSTCRITPFDCPSKEKYCYEHARELIQMNDKDRFAILLYAYNNLQLIEIEKICKVHPDLHSWFQSSDFSSRHDAFRKKHGEGILIAAAFLANHIRFYPYTYLRLKEKAQLNEILINFIESSSYLDIEKLLYKLKALLVFFNEQPSRASNPISHFDESAIRIQCKDLRWSFEEAYVGHYQIDPSKLISHLFE